MTLKWALPHAFASSVNSSTSLAHNTAHVPVHLFSRLLDLREERNTTQEQIEHQGWNASPGPFFKESCRAPSHCFSTAQEPPFPADPTTFPVPENRTASQTASPTACAHALVVANPYTPTSALAQAAMADSWLSVSVSGSTSCATAATPRHVDGLLVLHKAPCDAGTLNGEHRPRS